MIRLLTFRGRMTRGNFLVLGMILQAAVAGVERIAGWPHVAALPTLPTLPPPQLALVAGSALVQAALIVARLHDIGRTGGWAAVLVAALLAAKIAGPFGATALGVAVLGWLVLFVWPGQIGPNRFGPDPRGWESQAHFDAQQAALAEDARISARGGSRF